MLVEPKGLDAKALYRLMISVVVPRPIAWTSTVSADGVLNAAPFCTSRRSRASRRRS
jgi:flavin reductase (DIM6/NTAB) family NADH-FMN oxidoreductase RutF